MRPMIVTRIHRRCIVKYFGNCKNLVLWILSVAITVFILDNFIFSSNSLKRNNSTDDKVDTPINEKPRSEETHKNIAPSKNVSCGQSMKCLDDQYSYYIKSGLNKDEQPFICFNGDIIFSSDLKNGGRGLNLVTINDKTLAVESTKTFDTYEDDVIFQRFIKLGVQKNHIIILATFDEASLHLSQESKTLIGSYGSSLINELGFRDSFVMIGQQNLIPPSKAVEQLIKRNDGQMYATEAIIQGCANVPLGNRKTANVEDDKGESEVAMEDKVKLGDHFINCGLTEKCPADHFPVRLFTGKKNTELPKICFKGRYVVAQDLNGAGRGIMVVVININSGAIMKVERFDTYESRESSSSLVSFLKAVIPTEFILAVAHDEAQTALSDEAKLTLTSFGSSFISKIGFRDVWIFAGKPNLEGVSPYEDLEQGGKDTWPFSIDAQFCLNKKFTGNMTKVNLSKKKNLEKRNFCRKYDGYEEFCSEPQVDNYPTIQPQSEASMKDHPIYSVPIIIIPGINPKSQCKLLQIGLGGKGPTDFIVEKGLEIDERTKCLSQVAAMKQLEALYNIPGLNTNVVNVMYDEKFDEMRALSSLFNLTSVKLKSSTKYIDLVVSSLSEVWNKFPTAEYVIILEEEVLPTSDFLWYLGQCMDVLKKDESLVSVTSFNENGFKEVSGQPSVVYRGHSFPGLGVMLKKSFYTKYMSDNMKTCCYDRSWFRWDLPDGKEVLIPDVSRVTRRIYLGLTEYASFIREYFNRPRLSSDGKFVKLKDTSKLDAESYALYMRDLVNKASPISADDLLACIHSKKNFNLAKGMNVVYFEQAPDDSEDIVLGKLSKCFNLLSTEGSKFKTRGLHDSSIRFYVGENQVILVGSKSSYYKNKPANYTPLTKNSMQTMKS